MARSDSHAPPFPTRLIDGDVGVEIDWRCVPTDQELARLLVELLGEAELAALFDDRSDAGGQ